MIAPNPFDRPLSRAQVHLRPCAVLAQAVEAEVSSLLSCHADKLTDDAVTETNVFQLSQPGTFSDALPFHAVTNFRP